MTTATAGGHDRGARPGGSRGDVGELAGEVALAAAVVATHVLDHTVLPARWHTPVHLAVAAGAVAVALGLGFDVDELGLDPAAAARGLGHGLLHAATAAAVVTAAAAWPRTRALFVDDRVLDVSPRQLAATAGIHIPLGTAVYEEVLFRGVALAVLTRRLGPAGGLLAGAGLFGLWHVLPSLHDRERNAAAHERSQVATTAGVVATTAAAGLLFGWQRRRAGSVLAPVLGHAAANAVALAAAAVVARRPGPRPPADGATGVGATGTGTAGSGTAGTGTGTALS